MERNLKLFLSLSLLALILVLAGCGGGSGKKTPKNSLSSDYFGLQVNYTRTYNCSGYDVTGDPKEFSGVLIQTVLSESSGIFKTQSTVSFLDHSFGDFIEKKEDGKYYFIGDWRNDGEYSEYIEEPPYEIAMENPVKEGFLSCLFGTAKRQESVTVPAGTFNAWVFEYTYEDEENSYSETDIYYFVENIGIVYNSYIEEKDGKTIFSVTLSLSSYYISSSASSLASPSVGFTANSSTSLKLRKILRDKNKN